MNKNELILLLKQYKENKAKLNIKLKELNVLRLRLKALDNIDVSTSSGNYEINSDIHSKNKISDKVGNNVANNEDKKAELKSEIEQLEAETRELRDKAETVEDRLSSLKYTEKEILVAYYIEGRTLEDIGNKLYFQLFSQTRSGRHIQRIINRATQKMIKL